jgi:hypothetical protein
MYSCCRLQRSAALVYSVYSVGNTEVVIFSDLLAVDMLAGSRRTQLFVRINPVLEWTSMLCWCCLFIIVT